MNDLWFRIRFVWQKHACMSLDWGIEPQQSYIILSNPVLWLAEPYSEVSAALQIGLGTCASYYALIAVS